jgi:Flp pilus assembly protein TadG
MRHKLHFGRIGTDQSGATAVEFALLIGPFLFLLLGLLEVSIQYFVTTAVDYAMQRTARLVRTGQAQIQDLSVQDLRSTMCDEMLNLFDCMHNSYITIEELDSLNASTYTVPVKNDGTFLADRAIDMGTGGSYVIVRGFFQFSPLLDVFGALTPRLSNGHHLVVASVLFRNEPF